MALLYAGIDEAGYGPMLGPLAVGLCVLSCQGWDPGAGAPDLWGALSSGVSPSVRGARGRVAIADSKSLKLPNNAKTRHPLIHLERGVLAMLGAMGVDVRTDAALYEALGVVLPAEPWYGGPDVGLPLAHTQEEIAIAASMLGGAMDRAGVAVVGLRCEALGERSFNAIVREAGSKSAATMACVSSHLMWVLDAARGRDVGVGAHGVAHVRCVCDRQGGRTRYAAELERVPSVGSVRTLGEGDRASRYALGEGEAAPVVSFQMEAEGVHLPVAAASMVAKYVRELAMARFNRYWGSRVPELKATAGYTTDARRWLAEAGAAVRPEERAAMVRIS